MASSSFVAKTIIDLYEQYLVTNNVATRSFQFCYSKSVEPNLTVRCTKASSHSPFAICVVHLSCINEVSLGNNATDICFLTRFGLRILPK
jgi:hypothetical protein